MEISESIKRKRENSLRFRWLAGETEGIATGSALDVADIIADTKIDAFKGRYGEQLPYLHGNTPSTIEAARQLGVKRAWHSEKFFLNEKMAPKGGYWDEDGYKAWTNDQINQILSGERPHGIEGHHSQSVSGSRGDLSLASDPENIVFASRAGHLDLHQGNFRNRTFDEVNIISSRSKGTEQNYEERGDLVAYGVSGFIFASIEGIIHWRRLANDPRPWNRKAAIISGYTVLGGVFGVSIAIASNTVRSYIENNIGDVATEYATEVGLGASEEVFTDLLVSTGGIEAAILIRFSINFFKDIYGGKSLKGSAVQYGKELGRHCQLFCVK